MHLQSPSHKRAGVCFNEDAMLKAGLKHTLSHQLPRTPFCLSLLGLFVLYHGGGHPPPSQECPWGKAVKDVNLVPPAPQAPSLCLGCLSPNPSSRMAFDNPTRKGTLVGAQGSSFFFF